MPHGSGSPLQGSDCFRLSKISGMGLLEPYNLLTFPNRFAEGSWYSAGHRSGKIWGSVGSAVGVGMGMPITFAATGVGVSDGVSFILS